MTIPELRSRRVGKKKEKLSSELDRGGSWVFSIGERGKNSLRSTTPSPQH